LERPGAATDEKPEIVAPDGEHQVTYDKHGFEVPREQTKLNFDVIRRCYLLAKPFWWSRQGLKAWGVLALTLAVTVLQTVTTKWQLDLTAHTTNALIARQVALFWHYFWLAFWVQIAWTLIGMVQQPLLGLMMLWWRRSLTAEVLDKYMAHRAYYRIDQAKSVDNPDQRISDDVNNTTQAIFSIYGWASGIISTFAVYIPLLWNQAGPKIFFVLVISGLVTVIFPKIFSYLVKYDNVALKAEADFRFGLVRLREHSEPVAFYRGEGAEKETLLQRLDHIIRINAFLIVQNIYVGFATNAYYTVAGLLPTFLLYPLFFSHKFDYGYLQNVSQIAGSVQQQFAIGFQIFGQWLGIAVVVNRLWNLLEKCKLPSTQVWNNISFHIGKHLAVKNLSVETPNGDRTLIRDLNFALEPSTSLLVTGPSGTGKSSLLRTLAGLWNRGTGEITQPPLEKLAFLPQEPYMTLGDLREQLVYPIHDRVISDEKLVDMLNNVGLEALTSRFQLATMTDWETVLSPGERQRIAFGRLFLSHTSYAILDEATSAMDGALEERMYRSLRESGRAFISVAHRAALLNYHDFILQIKGGGTWSLTDMNGLTPEQRLQLLLL